NRTRDRPQNGRTQRRIGFLCPDFQGQADDPLSRRKLTCLPATPASLEGLDYTLAICDEIGRIDREVWTVIALAANTGNAEALTGMNRTPLVALPATALSAALAGCVVPGKAPAAPTATVTSTISAGTP